MVARWTTDDGRHEHVLGAAADPAAWKAEYARLIARLAADPGGPARRSTDYLVAELCRDYAKSPDVAPGKLGQYRRALRLLCDLYAETPAAEFGPRDLEAWRDDLCRRTRKDGSPAYSVTYVRELLAIVRRCWSWGVRRERVAPDRLAALRTVPGPRPGQCRPAKVVHAADPAAVEAALPLLTPPVRAMVELQRLTGARPSELFRLTPGDVLRAGRVRLAGAGEADLDRLGVWVIDYGRHKTAHRGKSRAIPLGPRAQAVLAPFLDRPKDAPCFSPREASRRAAGERAPGPRYTRHSYCQAVRRACARAGVAAWTPYQCRHEFLSEVDAAMGLDAAQHAAGHSSPQTTRRYAKVSLATAAAVARRLG